MTVIVLISLLYLLFGNTQAQIDCFDVKYTSLRAYIAKVLLLYF